MQPEAIETLRRIMSDSTAGVRVGGFARITSVGATAGTPTVDVEMAIEEPVDTPEGDRGSEVLPPLRDVPVMFPQCGPISITWPLVVGGTVFVLFLARDFTSWFVSGVVPSECLDSRAHSLDYAVALPCGFSTGSGPSTDPAALVINATSIMLGGPGSVLRAAVAELVKAELTRICEGFDAHTHIAPPSGGPTGVPTVSTPPITLSPAGDVHSNVVKVSG